MNCLYDYELFIAEQYDDFTAKRMQIGGIT